MQKLLCLFLVGLLLGLSPLLAPAIAQPSGDDLYYTCYGQRIPLVQRRDHIAVLLTPQPSGTRSSVSPYQQLQQTLLGRPSGTRSLEPAPALEVSVRPLGSRYAVDPLLSQHQSTLSEAVKALHPLFVVNYRNILTFCRLSFLFVN